MKIGVAVRRAIAGALLVAGWCAAGSPGGAWARVSYTEWVATSCQSIKTATTPAEVAVALANATLEFTAPLDFLRTSAAPAAASKVTARKADYDKIVADRTALYREYNRYQSPVGRQQAREAMDRAKQDLDKFLPQISERQRLQTELDQRGGLTRDEVADNTRRIRDLNADLTAKGYASFKQAHDDAKKIVDNWDKDSRELRDKVVAADAQQEKAKAAWDKAKVEADDVNQKMEALQEAIKGVKDCAAARLLELEPNSQAAHLESMLQGIESAIAGMERRASAMAAMCTRIDKVIRDAGATAVQVATEAELVTTQANAQMARQAAAQTAILATMQQAQVDAMAASVAVTQSRARAAKFKLDACSAAQIIARDPKGSDVASMLDMARRNQAAAEKEVAVTANELQRIRADYARAQAATVASGLDPETARGQVEALHQSVLVLAALPATLRQSLGASHLTVLQLQNVRTMLDSFKLGGPGGVDPQSPRGRFIQVHAERIRTLEERYTTQANIPDCSVRLNANLTALEPRIADATSKVAMARAATATLAPPAAVGIQLAQIEAIYDSARATADGTAADAVEALRCAKAAEAALNTNLGIKCRYQRPDGSPIEVTLFDVRTCPKDIPARFVDWKPAPKPDMLQDFSGKWVGREPKFEHLTVSGGTNVFSITYHWQADGRPGGGATHDWTAECKRDSSTTNAQCTGKGRYWDADKTAMYTFTMRLALHSDGKGLHFDGKFDTVDTRTTAGAPRDNSSVAGPGRSFSNSLRREAQ